MVSTEYSEAAVEVLDILKHTRKKDVEKIPKKFIKFLEENSSKTYKPNLDYSKSIKELRLKQKTQDILGVIYLKYWANEEQKVEFMEKAKVNEIKYQEKLREKYNQHNLFKNKKTKEEVVQDISKMQLQVISKETFIQKIIKKMKEIFRR